MPLFALIDICKACMMSHGDAKVGIPEYLDNQLNVEGILGVLQKDPTILRPEMHGWRDLICNFLHCYLRIRQVSRRTSSAYLSLDLNNLVFYRSLPRDIVPAINICVRFWSIQDNMSKFIADSEVPKLCEILRSCFTMFAVLSRTKKKHAHISGPATLEVLTSMSYDRLFEKCNKLLDLTDLDPMAHLSTIQWMTTWLGVDDSKAVRDRFVKNGYLARYVHIIRAVKKGTSAKSLPSKVLNFWTRVLVPTFSSTEGRAPAEIAAEIDEYKDHIVQGIRTGIVRSHAELLYDSGDTVSSTHGTPYCLPTSVCLGH